MWLQFTDKWLHNPFILLTLLVAFLATLASLVLIAGLVGASLAALLAAGTLPVAWKARNHMRAHTPELESTQTTLNKASNNEPLNDATPDKQ